MENLPACFLLTEGDIFLQNGVVFFTQQVDRLLHMCQQIVVPLATGYKPGRYA